jgi:HEAT repeat protein
MRQRFPRRARPLLAAAGLMFAASGIAAASHVARHGTGLYARLAVLQAMRSDDEDVRADALELLKKLGPRAAPAIASQALEKPLPDDLFSLLAAHADETTIKELEKSVVGQSESRRREAVAALGRVGSPEAILMAAPALADASPLVRNAAREAVRGRPPEVLAAAFGRAMAEPAFNPEFARAVFVEEGLVGSAARPIAEALRSGDHVRSWNALAFGKALFSSHPPGREHERDLIDALDLALQRLDAAASVSALEILSALSDPAAMRVMGAVALNRQAPEPTRVEALRVLASAATPEALGILEQAVRDPRFAVRFAAAEGLSRIGRPEDASRWLESIERREVDFEGREVMYRAIAGAGGAELTSRLIGLAPTMESPTLLETIRRVAAKDPSVSIPVLISTLADVAPQAASWLDQLLRELTWHRSVWRGDARTMEEFRRARDAVGKDWRRWWELHGAKSPEEWKAEGLREIEGELKSPDASIRFGAVARLVAIRPHDLENRVLALLSDPEPFVWDKAFDAIAEDLSPGARELLRARIPAGAAREASRAARALGRVGDRVALDALLKGLDREEPAVRRGCAWALGRIPDPKASRPLFPLLRSDDSDLRSAARDALQEIADPSLEGDLIAGLGTEDTEYRVTCAGLLGRCGTSAAVRPLAKLLGDPEELVMRAAMRALHTLIGRPPKTLTPTDFELTQWEEEAARRPK